MKKRNRISSICLALAFSVSVLCLAGCGGGSSTATNAGVENKSSEATSAPSTATPEIKDMYYAGTYKVGIDIPAGGYDLTQEALTPEEQKRQDAGERTYKAYVTIWENELKEKSVFDDGFTGSCHVSVSDGQVLDVRDATFVAA